jgi:hypothetical protein
LSDSYEKEVIKQPNNWPYVFVISIRRFLLNPSFLQCMSIISCEDLFPTLMNINSSTHFVFIFQLNSAHN